MHGSCSLRVLLLLPPLLLLLVATTGPARALLEEEKHAMVQLHNLYRAQVSPPASDMLRMSWDDELAAFAKAYAQRCVWGHNKERGRRGENLFAITDEGLDVPLAMEEWFHEREHYNLSAAACDPGQMCGHYTQLVWSRTERIGCGSHFCEKLQGVEETNIHLLVCNYEPPGNVKGKRPYQEGTPCSQCPPGYRCKNSLCEPVEGPEEAQDLPFPATEAPSTRAAEASGSGRAGSPSLATEMPRSSATEGSGSLATKAPSSLATEPSSLATEARPSLTSGVPSEPRPSLTSGVPSETQPSLTSGVPSEARPSLTSGVPLEARPSLTSGVPEARPSLTSGVTSEARPSLTSGVPSEARPSLTSGVPSEATHHPLSVDEGPVIFPQSTHVPVPKYAGKVDSRTRAPSVSPERSLHPKMSPTGPREPLPSAQEEAGVEAEAGAELPAPSEVLASVFPSEDKPDELQASRDCAGHSSSKSPPDSPHASASSNNMGGRVLALQSSLPGAEGPGRESRAKSSGPMWNPPLGLLLLPPLVLVATF